MTKVREFFMLDEDYEQHYLNQEEKLIEYLEQACFMFTNMYEVWTLATSFPALHVFLICLMSRPERLSSSNINIPERRDTMGTRLGH